MTIFGYTASSCEAAKTRIDRDLESAEFYLDRISKAVPEIGAITTRLDEAKEIAQGVASDLHDVIDQRTEVGV